MLFRRDKLIHLALIAAFAAAAVAPMLVFGVPGGNDAVQHFEFAQQVVDAVRSGDLFPSFAAGSNHGFGDVGLRVYPPAAYYMLAGSYFLFGSWYWASIVTFFLIFLAGSVGVYLWVGESFPAKTAASAAVLFTLMPFHLNEIYNNFLFAQFAASAVLPFCFLFTLRLVRRGRLIDSIGLAVAFGFLIITHLPMTIIGSFALIIYAIATLDGNKFQQIAKLAVSVAGSIALSSFYWVRMVTEMSWVKHSAPQYFANTWSFSENYLLSRRTFTEFLNDDLGLWFGDVILLVTLVFCAPALIYFFRRIDLRNALLPLVIVFGVAVLMTTPLSSVVWDNFSLLHKVQFPWRWLSIISLTGSVVAACGLVTAADDVKKIDSRAAMLGVSAVVLPFIIVSAFIVKAPHYTPRTEFDKGSERFSAGETFEGWWPTWARREAFSDAGKILITDRTVTLRSWQPLERSFDVGQGRPGMATVNTFYYPHWKVRVNGELVDVRPDQLGLISFDLKGEPASVSLRFEERPVVRLAAWFSFACWLSAFAGCVICLFRRESEYGTYR